MIQLSLEATISDSTIIDVTCKCSILHCLHTRVWEVGKNGISLCHIYTTHIELYHTIILLLTLQLI